MESRLFLTVFATVFVAELGDKTQLATLLYATDAHHSKLVVFLAAASALVVASALGVLAGGLISRYVSAQTLSWVAGTGFILIGMWTILQGARA